MRLLIKTVPIYSKQFYKEQFGEQKSKVKGWTYIRTGIYWCNRAFDKGAKGGKVWKVDMDEWREGGKKGQGWEVPLKEEAISDPAEEEESGVSEDEGSEHAAEEPADSEGGSEGEDKGSGRKSRKKAVPPPKRKERSHKAKGGDKATPQKRSRARRPHPQQSSSRLPAQVPSLQDLPADPYQRAMRLLHVGATPESLPCREEEFIDVLSRVEEGVESGGGGCLYIAGVPGTGKTATVHAVVKELKRKAEDGVSQIHRIKASADGDCRKSRHSRMSRSTVSRFPRRSTPTPCCGKPSPGRPMLVRRPLYEGSRPTSRERLAASAVLEDILSLF